MRNTVISLFVGRVFFLVKIFVGKDWEVIISWLSLFAHVLVGRSALCSDYGESGEVVVGTC